MAPSLVLNVPFLLFSVTAVLPSPTKSSRTPVNHVVTRASGLLRNLGVE